MKGDAKVKKGKILFYVAVSVLVALAVVAIVRMRRPAEGDDVEEGPVRKSARIADVSRQGRGTADDGEEVMSGGEDDGSGGMEEGVDAEPEQTEEEKAADAAEALVDAFDDLTDSFREIDDEKEISMDDVKKFHAQFKKVPKDRKEECLQRALNLIPDENVMLLAGILMDKEEDGELVELVFNDILNRNEDMKQILLKEIYKDKTHPCWSDAAWILDVTAKDDGDATMDGEESE